jgi:hypothetical protein
MDLRKSSAIITTKVQVGFGVLQNEVLKISELKGIPLMVQKTEF